MEYTACFFGLPADFQKAFLCSFPMLLRGGGVPHEETIRKELKRCADEIASVDLSMQTIRDILKSDIWK